MSGGSESYVPLPLDGLPGVLGEFVAECSTTTGCDPACVAVPLLACLASAIGTKRVVTLDNGRREPSVIWGAVIGETDSQWRPGFDAATAIVRRKEQEARSRHTMAMQKYAFDFCHYLAFKRLSSRLIKPIEPVLERFVVQHATIAALVDLLAKSRNGLLLLDDDLARRLERSTTNDSESSQLQAMWSGTPLLKDRVGKTIYIEYPLVSMAGGIRPVALRRAFHREGRQHRQDRQDSQRSHDGDVRLFAKLLVAMPPPPPIAKLPDAVASGTAEARLAELFNKLYTMEVARDALGRIMPSELALSHEAERDWMQFRDRCQSEQANMTAYLAAAWAHLPAYVARFALVLHLCRWAEEQPVDPALVDAESLRAAVRLVEWFGGEARRVYTALTAPEVRDPTTRTLDLIRRKGGRVTAREFQQSDRRFRNDAAGAEAELERMIQLGYGDWEQVPTTRKRGRPTDVFVLTMASIVYGNAKIAEKKRIA